MQARATARASLFSPHGIARRQPFNDARAMARAYSMYTDTETALLEQNHTTCYFCLAT